MGSLLKKIDLRVHGWETHNIPESFTGFKQHTRFGMTPEHRRAELCPHHSRSYDETTGVFKCLICGRARRFADKPSSAIVYSTIGNKKYNIPVGEFPTKEEYEIAKKKSAIDAEYASKIKDLRIDKEEKESKAYKLTERRQLNSILEEEGFHIWEFSIGTWLSDDVR